MKNATQNTKFVRRLVLTGFVAAVYFVITLLAYHMSYVGVQFRIAEVLNLLVFVNPAFAPGVVLGVLLSNIISPIPFDWLIGTASTGLAVVFIVGTRKILGNAPRVGLLVSAIWPVIFSGIIVGLMLTFLTDFGLPFGFADTEVYFVRFLAFTLSVMVGQFVVCVVIGVPLFCELMKNERLMKFLKEF
ncbi:MAG: QueT transporter family protein [Defluviitaleaceae bacterium]|nr:QueT transporter family protein [Defluviitaleaceae bacterium]